MEAGTELFRNLNTARVAQMGRKTAERYIPVVMELHYESGCLRLTCNDEYGHEVTVTLQGTFEQARTEQGPARHNVMSKLGDTDFRLKNFQDCAGDIFIPASVLTQLRRDAVDALKHARAATYKYEYRRKALEGTSYPVPEVDYHANVANSNAEEFYKSHGVRVIMPAAELKMPGGIPRVMTTRYCVRAELGMCPRMNPQLKAEPLYLRHGKLVYRLEFTCGHCGMEVFQENA